MASKLVSAKIYRIHRDLSRGEKNNDGAVIKEPTPLLRINCTDNADDATILTPRLSGHPAALEISKRTLSDAGLPPELMDCPKEQFAEIATKVLDRELQLRVIETEVPVIDPKTKLQTSTRPGIEVLLEPVSRVAATI